MKNNDFVSNVHIGRLNGSLFGKTITNTNLGSLDGTIEVGKDAIIVGRNTFVGNMSIQRMTGTINGPFGSIVVNGQKVEIVDGVVSVNGVRADRLAGGTEEKADGKDGDESPSAPKAEKAGESRRTVNIHVHADASHNHKVGASAASVRGEPTGEQFADSKKQQATDVLAQRALIRQAVNGLSLRALLLNAAFAAFFPSPLYLGVCLAVATAVGLGLLMDHSDKHRVRVVGFGLKVASVAWIIGSLIYFAGSYISTLLS